MDGRDGTTSTRRPGVGVGVGVLVVRNGRLLLVKRRYHGAGSWATPGGYLDAGESFEACAAREVEEETGLRVDRVVVRGVTNDVHPDGKHNVTVWCSARAAAGEATVAAPDEVAEVGWFAWDDLPAPLYLSTANVLDGQSYPEDAGRRARNER